MKVQNPQTTMLFNVHYDAPDGLRQYCMVGQPLADAQKSLEDFKRRYQNPDGTPKAWPNGKGFYDLANPRVAEHIQNSNEDAMVVELERMAKLGAFKRHGYHGRHAVHG